MGVPWAAVQLEFPISVKNHCLTQITLSSDNGLADIEKNFCHQVATQRTQSLSFVQHSCAQKKQGVWCQDWLIYTSIRSMLWVPPSRNQSEIQRPHPKLNFLFLLLTLCLLIPQEVGHNTSNAATSLHSCPKSRTGKERSRDFVDNKLSLLRHSHQL